MQNPFTSSFSKTPKYTNIHTEKIDEILENFVYDRPSESVYKITGVRGSGKTVILAKIEEELRKNTDVYKNWLVFDIDPTKNILEQIAAMLEEVGFGEERNELFDIGVEIEEMIKRAQDKGMKIFIGIDEIYKSDEVVMFISEYGGWLRAGYPIYFAV